VGQLSDLLAITFRTKDATEDRRLIVDWEMAGIGDPCWDLGSVLNDYLSFWLLSIPITGETEPEEFLNLVKFPLARMQPAIRAFWRSYVKQIELDDVTSNQWLLRAVRYAAARLLQTTYEQMQVAMLVTGNVVCLLQLSLNMLMRPREAAVQLLGLPLTDTAFPWPTTVLSSKR
jgi:hypothetical protein